MADGVERAHQVKGAFLREPVDDVGVDRADRDFATGRSSVSRRGRPWRLPNSWTTTRSGCERALVRTDQT
ncbi:hypothetical protein [Streptomyces sp. NPDC058545]|uniref:hypothetical protein n=1 Tax=Streptomyces sp. NPDC058545 TaxID=3346544 RepID=UPI003659BA6F